MVQYTISDTDMEEILNLIAIKQKQVLSKIEYDTGLQTASHLNQLHFLRTLETSLKKVVLKTHIAGFVYGK